VVWTGFKFLKDCMFFTILVCCNELVGFFSMEMEPGQKPLLPKKNLLPRSHYVTCLDRRHFCAGTLQFRLKMLALAAVCDYCR
jgi:hypothetical protein